jgi:predicted nucleic acid-binding protein
MSFLLDTDVLSVMERKRIPSKLSRWVLENESEIFLSVVSFAEIQFGISRAPPLHRPGLMVWLAATRRMFAHATEPLSEAVLVKWKELLSDLKRKNRTMTCEDSLIAATALFFGHTVATGNERHFQPSGVQTINPLV